MVGEWRNLERRVAQYLERNGYSARTNVQQLGRSGLSHELDVLAEKRDAAGSHRVAVECKAWRSPVEKDVVYKLEKVMQDVGLSKGIVVSVGGARSGARVAADQAHIEIWGPDEIRHYLGDEAFAGLPLAAPDEALGVEVAVGSPAAEREIRKARGGIAGLGAEEVAAVDLVWLPSFELQLAITRIRPGLMRDKEELIRRSLLVEALTGRLSGQLDQPRSFVTVRLDGAVLPQQRSTAQVVADMRKVLGKHRNAKSDAAQTARKKAYNAIGLPGSTREFAVEAETPVYVPYYVGTLRRKASERLIAVHAGVGSRTEGVEQALHEKVHLLREALQPPPIPIESPIPVPIETARVCRCGEPMVLRHRKADGAPFWGCSTFPRCRHTEAAE